ncbi:nucleotide exchange factor GrpE [Candidatus Bathyarchaeota archaeon]|nr:nucleotide exchange factor GrpE [Candidatus Bathyarchaeota archaeon]
MTKNKNKTTRPSRIPMSKSEEKKEIKKSQKKLEEQLILEQEKNREFLARFKYLQADFENYRKRMEKEVQDAANRSNEKLVKELIEVIDDFENAISAGETTENKDALLEGVKMVHKKLDTLLAKEGLERLECIGKQFNPNQHEILTQVPTKKHQTGTVLEEARKGFLFKGKIMRPSVVTIACECSKGEKNE